jgi:hypothetical protein
MRNSIFHLSRRSSPGVVCAIALAACGGGGDSVGVGTLRVALTDAPACGYQAVNVTIEKIRVHQSSTAGDNDSGWSDLTLSPARRVNLLNLTNGVLEELGQTSLPAGRYTQLRLVLAANDATHPMANSLVPMGGMETALTTPSGQQSGLKLNANVDVGANQIADVVLDFDACRSIVPRGASGQFNLKPVIVVVPRIIDVGRIEGFVDAVIASTSIVSVQLNGRPVKATPPDAAGGFVLYPVPVGNYTLVVSAAGRVTAAMTGVPVATTAPTVVSTPTVRIVPPVAASAPGVVSGTVITTPPASASVRALQTLPSMTATTVEVAWTAANDATGLFSLSLPIDAPARTAYAANPAAINFAAEPSAAGLYRLEAVSGTAAKSQDIDVRTPVPPVNFAFP